MFHLVLWCACGIGLPGDNDILDRCAREWGVTYYYITLLLVYMSRN